MDKLDKDVLKGAAVFAIVAGGAYYAFRLMNPKPPSQAAPISSGPIPLQARTLKQALWETSNSEVDPTRYRSDTARFGPSQMAAALSA